MARPDPDHRRVQRQVRILLPGLGNKPHRTLTKLRRILPRCWHDHHPLEESDPPRDPGRFSVPGTDSYIDVAEGRQPPATYFSLGDSWGNIADAHNLSDDDMFDAFNVPFLERMMAEKKPISFSHSPEDFPDSALADELEFLENHGYEFKAATMQAVPR